MEYERQRKQKWIYPVCSKEKAETKASSVKIEEEPIESVSPVQESHSGTISKDGYYCKFCDTSWPFSHFRNAQQFGAHCSNCSRKRRVKDPQESRVKDKEKEKKKKKNKEKEEEREKTKAKEKDIEKDKAKEKEKDKKKDKRKEKADTDKDTDKEKEKRKDIEKKIYRSKKRFKRDEAELSSSDINSPQSTSNLSAEQEQQEQQNDYNAQLKAILLKLDKENTEQNASALAKLQFDSSYILQEMYTNTVAKIEAVQLELLSEIWFSHWRVQRQVEDAMKQIQHFKRLLLQTEENREREALFDVGHTSAEDLQQGSALAEGGGTHQLITPAADDGGSKQLAPAKVWTKEILLR